MKELRDCRRQRKMCIFLHCLSLWSLHLNFLPSQGASGFFSYVQYYQADSWALEKRPSFVPVRSTSVFLGLSNAVWHDVGSCAQNQVGITHRHTHTHTTPTLTHNVVKTIPPHYRTYHHAHTHIHPYYKISKLQKAEEDSASPMGKHLNISHAIPPLLFLQ